MASKSTQAIQWDVYKPRNWGRPTKAHELPKPWYGLDTERDASGAGHPDRGKFVCGFYVGADGEHRFETLQDLPKGTYWVWNLAYDVEGMLRDLGVDEAWAAKKDAANFKLLGGRCRYFHGKRFDWNGPNGRVTMIEASSFWGRVPLAVVGAKDNMDASKMSLQAYQEDRLYEREAPACSIETKQKEWHTYGEWGYFRQDTDAYCIQDAKIVFDAVVELDLGMQQLGVAIGGTPGATARRFLTRLPPFSEQCWIGHKAFLRSYCGGRFEVVKRGYFEDLYQYDIKSAYPWALSQCPFLTDTAEQYITKSVGNDALYGSYLVDFRTDEYLGISPEWSDGVRVYSKAQNRTWLSLPEVQWLEREGYDYTVHRGVEVVDENATTAWADLILDLYAIKDKYRDEPLGKAAKIVLNSMYGVLIQLIPKAGQWMPLAEAMAKNIDGQDFAGDLVFVGGPDAFEAGQYYAPIYAGHLTALTRVKLLDAAILAGEAYVGGHTDSVLSLKPLDLPRGGLGDWDLEVHAKEGNVSKTGMYALDGKVKMRGITREGGAEMLWQEYHVRNQRMGIKRAMQWDDVSVINPLRVRNNYHIENKRKWAEPFTLDVVRERRWIDSEALQYV